METSKSTFSVSFFAQRTKVNKRTGLAPIIGRITVDGDSVHFSAKMHIAPDRWAVDEKGKSAGKTVGKTVAEKKINENLEDLRAALRNKYNQILVLGMPVTASTLRDGLFKQSSGKKKAEKETKLDSVMLVEFCESYNDKYFKLVELGKRTRRTWSRYVHLFGKVKAFMKDEYQIENIALHEMTPEFFEDFFFWLRDKHPDQDHNYHMKMVQRLGTVHRKAKKYGHVKEDPFGNFEVSFEKKDRGYLDEMEVMKIINTPMPSNKLDRVRDFFVFSIYTGLAYRDFKKLRKDELKVHTDGQTWIHTERGKTGIQCDVPLLDIPMQLIDKYRDDTASEFRMKVSSLKCVNDYLKTIQAICGIEKRLSFHVARTPSPPRLRYSMVYRLRRYRRCLATAALGLHRFTQGLSTRR